MFKLGKDPNVYPQVRSEIFDKLNDLSRWLNNNRQLKYSDYYSNQIKQFNLQPEILIPNKPERIPDGSPIGLIACDL